MKLNKFWTTLIFFNKSEVIVYRGKVKKFKKIIEYKNYSSVKQSNTIFF